MRLLLSLLFCVFTLGWKAQALEPADLRTSAIKLSKALRGIPLNVEEGAALEDAIKTNQGETFYQDLIGKFLGTPQFERKLKMKVDEMLGLKTELGTPTGYTSYDNEELQVLKLTGSSTDNLIRQIIATNANWDQLLLAKDYSFQFSTMSFSETLHERQFFAPLTGINVTAPGIDQLNYFDLAKQGEVHFDKKDPRVAGILTTPRFLSRYVNTALNKNRRRAAAVFRIFLCDSMMAAVPPRDSSSEMADYDLIFPHSGTEKEQDLRANMGEAAHGSQKDCMACHYKLDPLGLTFGYSASGLAPEPTPGALAYLSSNQEKINIPVKGVGELGETITQQADYVRCQVNHFWNWYIGRDLPKSAKRDEELAAKFEQLGRKPKDFISYLVHTPEFRSKPKLLSESQLLARAATRILKNCTDCHRNQDDDPNMQSWDMTELPYGQTPAERKEAFDKIAKALDLHGDGSHRKMPPKSSLWKLSDDQYATLKKWVRSGAPDYDGNNQVEPW